MGTVDKFINFMKMNNQDDEDDEYVDSDYLDEEEDSAPQIKRVTPPVEEDDDKPVRRARAQASARSNASRKGAAMNNQPNMEICFCKPATFEDATQVADALLNNRSVVLNLEGLDMTLAQRIFDFATGATYAMQGRLEAISKYVYMITPETVNISGDTLEGSGALGKTFS